MTPDQWRDQVGRHLEARREALGYSSRYQIADGIDVSESWVRGMESGEVRRNDGTMTTPNPRGNKLRAYLDRLQWPADAIDQLLAGTDPEQLDDAAGDDPADGPDLRTTVARLADLVEELEQTIRSHWPRGQ